MVFRAVVGGMGFMLGTGGSALVAKVLGENKKELAHRYFTMVIIFAVILGAALTAFDVGLMRPIAS